ncbi:MAG: aquaporin [Fimbriimonadia bacterium]|jgi:MIP family channel proteins
MQPFSFRSGLAELLGTFLLVVVGGGAICAVTVRGGSGEAMAVRAALANGFALAVIVYAFAHVSGGAANPAVNLAAWIGGRLSAAGMLMYTVFQLVGGIVGGFVLRAVYAKVVDETIILGAPGYNLDGRDIVSPVRAGLTEVVFTFFLVLVVMACLFDERRRAKQLFGLCVGLAYSAAIFATFSMTGAGLNPAKYLGSALAAGALQQAGVFLIAPLIGAALAAIAYRFLFMGGLGSTEEEA